AQRRRYIEAERLGGLEPVHAVASLTARTATRLNLIRGSTTDVAVRAAAPRSASPRQAKSQHHVAYVRACRIAHKARRARNCPETQPGRSALLGPSRPSHSLRWGPRLAR